MNEKSNEQLTASCCRFSEVGADDLTEVSGGNVAVTTLAYKLGFYLGYRVASLI